jgi:hypothetical protein
MSFAKRFGLKLIASVFTLSLFGLAVTAAVNHVFSKPDNLKQALRDGKVYDAVADSIVDQAVKDADKQTDIPLDNKKVQSAARAAVTPKLIQENGEKIIDGTYSWLEGDTPTPEFRLDTQEIKDQVATNVSKAGEARVKKLPACTYAQLQRIDINSVDPFALECRPPGLDLTALRKQYQKEIAASDAFLEESALTAEDVENDQGQNVFEQAERVPQAFQLGQKLPWIFGILAVLSGIGLVFLNTTKAQGLKSAGLTLLIASALLFVSLFVVSFLLNQAKPDIGAETVVQDAVLAVLKTLSSALNRVLLIFAITYAVLGSGSLIGSRFLKKAQTSTNSPDSREKTPNPKQPSQNQ